MKRKIKFMAAGFIALCVLCFRAHGAESSADGKAAFRSAVYKLLYERVKVAALADV